MNNKNIAFVDTNNIFLFQDIQLDQNFQDKLFKIMQFLKNELKIDVIKVYLKTSAPKDELMNFKQKLQEKFKNIELYYVTKKLAGFPDYDVTLAVHALMACIEDNYNHIYLVTGDCGYSVLADVLSKKYNCLVTLIANRKSCSLNLLKHVERIIYIPEDLLT